MAAEIRETGGRTAGGAGMLGVSTNGHAAGHEVIDLTDDSLHIEGAEPRPLDDSEVDVAHQDRFGALENLIDAFVEAFNAHDLDGSTVLLADDVELPGLGDDRTGFADAAEAIWERRPHAILTRGLLDEEPVTVVWDIDERGGWQRLALFCFDGAVDSEHLGLIELIDDATIAADVETVEPEHDVVEGATWDEWYEGAAPA